MNRPTPDPSQEGSGRPSASYSFPSWEGLGVGSWSQCALPTAWRLSMNLPLYRQVLECASPLALCDLFRGRKSGRGLPQSKTLARLRPPRRGSWSQCALPMAWRLSMNLPAYRQVLERAGPLALSDLFRGRKSGRGLSQSKTRACGRLVGLHSPFRFVMACFGWAPGNGFRPCLFIGCPKQLPTG